MTNNPERLRLFIDETTSLDKARYGEDHKRYISLTGVIVRLSTLRNQLTADFDALRTKYFGHTSATPIILHRTSIRSGKGAFKVLKDDKARAEWGNEFVKFLADTRFGVITVCVDKSEFEARGWHLKRDPYHFAMITMLERFVLCMRANNMVGDVIAEGRTRPEDDRLREAFRNFRGHKSWYISQPEIQKRLTCHKLKVLQKKKDVVGLQLCDLIATPSIYNCFHHYLGHDFPSAYTKKIAEILESTKYIRNPQTKKIDGHGRVWRPK